MNVLILTPDRVGSTLLQRLITIYMLNRGFDKNVINLHELTNGLEKYYNSTLQQEVLGKPHRTQWGYFQKLEEIESLLASADHYKTSRLAHYHIVARKDTLEEQVKFYKYLNENFFIISCRRDNLFEHALSWAIQNQSKTLNVYSTQEKVDVFRDIYKDGITVDQDTLNTYLKKYQDYIAWSDTYFDVQAYFDYDTDIHRIEDYILNLDFMKGAGSWKDSYGQSFEDWNTCHRLLPNLFLRNPVGDESFKLAGRQNKNLALEWDMLKGSDWPDTLEAYHSNKNSLTENIRNEIETFVNPTINIAITAQEKMFLNEHFVDYQSTEQKIKDLVLTGNLVTTVPVKLQSLEEKKSVIKNFSQCVDWYNAWVTENKFGKHYTESELAAIGYEEEAKLNLPIASQNLLN